MNFILLPVVVVLCVNPEDEHRFLQSAETLGMTDGQYVYMTIDQTPPANVRTPWVISGVINHEVKYIYKHVLQVTRSCTLDFDHKLECRSIRTASKYSGSIYLSCLNLQFR